jgi:hypothetical protein
MAKRHNTIKAHDESVAALFGDMIDALAFARPRFHRFDIASRVRLMGEWEDLIHATKAMGYDLSLNLHGFDGVPSLGEIAERAAKGIDFRREQAVEWARVFMREADFPTDWLNREWTMANAKRNNWATLDRHHARVILARAIASVATSDSVKASASRVDELLWAQVYGAAAGLFRLGTIAPDPEIVALARYYLLGRDGMGVVVTEFSVDGAMPNGYRQADADQWRAEVSALCDKAVNR